MIENLHCVGICQEEAVKLSDEISSIIYLIKVKNKMEYQGIGKHVWRRKEVLGQKGSLRVLSFVL